MNPPFLSPTLEPPPLRDYAYEPVLRAYQPFPVECFPAPIRDYVTSVSAAQDCDPAYLALPVLSSLAAAVGSSHQLFIKQFWREPAVLWTAVVSDGMTNTRSVMDAAAAPFDIMRQLGLYTDRQWTSFSQKKENADRVKQLVPPLICRHLVRDSRLKTLVPLLERERRGLLLRLDQLDGWLGRPNSTSGKRIAEVSQWVDIHGCRPVSMELRRKRIDAAYPTVSLLGTVQAQTLSDKFLKARVPCELTSRVLFAAPPSRPRRWTLDDVSPEVGRAYVATVMAMTKLEFKGKIDPPHPMLQESQPCAKHAPKPCPHNEPPTLDGNAEPPVNTQLIPMDVKLSPEAQALFGGFVDWVASEQWDVDELLIPWYTQLTSHAARLALILHLARCVQEDNLDMRLCDAASMQAGITLARWFAQEARRVITLFSVSRDTQEQGRLIEWLHRRGGLATCRDLCRSNGRRYSTDDEARAALDRLAETGVGVWIDFPAGKNGGPPCRAFSLGRSYFEPLPQFADVVPATVAACETKKETSAECLVKDSERGVPSDRSGEKDAEASGGGPTEGQTPGCVGQECENRDDQAGGGQNCPDQDKNQGGQEQDRRGNGPSGSGARSGSVGQAWKKSRAKARRRKGRR